MTFLYLFSVFTTTVLAFGHGADARLAQRRLGSLQHHEPQGLQERQNPVNASGVLENFQVQQPPVVPKGKACTHMLVHHLFGNSYGAPAVVDYNPPTDCGAVGSWASVVLNFTATSNGTQYDRLSHIWLNDVEIWRTSTAEPTRRGIIWTTFRDVTKYMPLLSTPNSKLILELNNVIDPSININGEFDVTLSATFYAPTPSFPAPPKADAILPLSTKSKTSGSVFSVPGPGVTDLIIPENTATAFVEIYASGNSQEEFWYANTVDSYIPYADPTGSNGLVGNGPFREVQLWIDGRLAGAVLPYPVVFTGGIILTWWRPMSAYGSFEQPTYTIDVTPFLPILTDNKSHNFTLTVEGQGVNKSINNNWFLSGNVALTLDPSGTRTTGSVDVYETKPFVESVGKVAEGNKSVEVTVKAGRSLNVESTVVTGTGGSQKATFSQSLGYTNVQVLTNSGLTQSVNQSSTGLFASTRAGKPILSDRFSYPFIMHSDYTGTNDAYTGTLDHSYHRTLLPPPFSGFSTTIDTQQLSTGNLTLNATTGRATGGVGTTSQIFDYSDALHNTYHRDVAVSNVTVLHDKESGSLAGSPAMGVSRMGMSGDTPAAGPGGPIDGAMAKPFRSMRGVTDALLPPLVRL